MTYNRKLTAAAIALTLSILVTSNTWAQRHGGFGGGGFGGRGGGFGRPGFAGGAFRGGGFAGRGFRGDGFRGDRFRHRGFNDGFGFFGDFDDPFFYYPYPYYGNYPYGDYPYGYGYEAYNEPVYNSTARTRDSVVGEVQVRLARSGYYHGALDGVIGSATRTAIRNYERAHSLPADGRIGGRLLTNMGLG